MIKVDYGDRRAVALVSAATKMVSVIYADAPKAIIHRNQSPDRTWQEATPFLKLNTDVETAEVRSHPLGLLIIGHEHGAAHFRSVNATHGVPGAVEEHSQQSFDAAASIFASEAFGSGAEW